ncbi:Response regulator receiver domain-containing protein [Cyclobacterium xiamenense]|uniref:Response regulator receiver domain-containing protein n=1 Tax=Cyclobacterium xiamenense TaxID=1297121 RepID=A0A1H6Z8S0_9BACT|nr:response regulator [Cyclobacterium xiamenense]SEJ45950.1 Response regulator receiver domain-containing protein [Cyclobacterium xiamenense]
MEKIGFTYIVDDDPLYNFGTKKILEFTAFSEEVSYFLNGEDAFKDLSKRIQEGAPLPDIILLDINMPIMNGWEFLEQVSKTDLNHPIKIFMVSSSINQDEIDRANSYPLVAEYIVKPLTLEKVKALKSRILDQ